MLYNINTLSFCTVFFMVLDLRLAMKIGCRMTTFSFFYTDLYRIHHLFLLLIERLKDIAKIILLCRYILEFKR